MIPGAPIARNYLLPCWEGDVEHLDEALPGGERVDQKKICPPFSVFNLNFKFVHTIFGFKI